LNAGEATLSARFDIFKQPPDGKDYWVEAAKDRDAATPRVRILAETFPGQHVIVDNSTVERFLLARS
jgi:hypothetical protein